MYQFTTTVRARLSINSDDHENYYPSPGINNDFYLLNTTATTNGIATALGRPIVVDGCFGIFEPGTYFISIDAYSGVNSWWTGNEGPFNAVFTIAPAGPPASVSAIPSGAITTTLSAGQVLWFTFNHPGGTFSVDTAGSTLTPRNDTELFLFNSNGIVMASNDDIGPGNCLSRISTPSLAAGTYYLAACGYNHHTTYDCNFTVFAFGTSVEAGQLVLNGLTVTPEPSTPDLAAVSLLGNTLTLRVMGMVGRTILIEKSPSLESGSWVQDGAPVNLTTAEQIITRTVGAGEIRMFFRARQQ